MPPTPCTTATPRFGAGIGSSSTFPGLSTVDNITIKGGTFNILGWSGALVLENLVIERGEFGLQATTAGALGAGFASLGESIVRTLTVLGG
jgi:hypothetical protein